SSILPGDGREWSEESPAQTGCLRPPSPRDAPTATAARSVVEALSRAPRTCRRSAPHRRRPSASPLRRLSPWLLPHHISMVLEISDNVKQEYRLSELRPTHGRSTSPTMKLVFDKIVKGDPFPCTLIRLLPDCDRWSLASTLPYEPASGLPSSRELGLCPCVRPRTRRTGSRRLDDRWQRTAEGTRSPSAEGRTIMRPEEKAHSKDKETVMSTKGS